MAASSIYYYKNDGSGISEPGVGSTIKEISYFGWTREGYVFANWNTEPDNSGTSYNGGDAVPYPEPSALYAIWNKPEATNKVIFGGQTVVDLTQDTATEGTVLAGYTFHKANGQQTVGTYTPQAVSLQSKSATYTPATSQQTATITADSGYDGLSSVGITVNAMPSGTEGTPIATKGTVSNHAVSVTPSVTNTTGYITGGTKTGTAVSVSASELVSGTYSVTSSGTKDVTNFASASVPSGTASTPSTTITANPTITVGSDGLITASVSKTQSVTPTVTSGYISSGTAGTITVSGSNTSQLSVYNGGHHQPTPSGYTVTVSLTNPIGGSDFQNCNITELVTSDTEGSLLGQITSATGTAEFVVPSSSYGVTVVLEGNWGTSYTDENIACTGGISFIKRDAMNIDYFEVTGNGTITYDGVDYSD